MLKDRFDRQKRFCWNYFLENIIPLIFPEIVYLFDRLYCALERYFRRKLKQRDIDFVFFIIENGSADNSLSHVLSLVTKPITFIFLKTCIIRLLFRFLII